MGDVETLGFAEGEDDCNADIDGDSEGSEVGRWESEPIHRWLQWKTPKGKDADG